MLPTLNVARHERVLWFEDDNLVDVLGPGRHTIWRNLWSRRSRFERYNTLDFRFEHKLLGQLNGEKAEETAAARSQANTAKLLAENPTLGRLKELEALAGILAGAKTTFVFGSGDMSEQVRSLVTASRE